MKTALAALLFACTGAAPLHAAHAPPTNAPKVKPSFELRLDGTLVGRAGDKEIVGTLAPGAAFVPSVEGKGVAPAADGPAVSVSLPPELWTKEGTLALRFKTPRTLRGRGEGDKPSGGVILRCPIFTLSLDEQPDAVCLSVRLATDGSVKDKQVLDRFALGKLDLSRLDADKWYHLAISWDARFPENRLEAYLNGAAQQEMRGGRAWWHPWRLPKDLDGKLDLGGTVGEGERRAAIAVDSVQLFPTFMYEEDIAEVLKGRPNFALTGEGRWDYAGALDLTPYRLSMVYETQFDDPLNVAAEADLFEGDKRVRLPEGKDWVLESDGNALAWTQDGLCSVLNNGSHSVLWNTRTFPEDFLLEFGSQPKDSGHGLAIVFFGARGVDGGSIFDLNQPCRRGAFRAYIRGQIKAYHASYWATTHQMLRRTSNLRKDPGIDMLAVGIDRIGGVGHGPHRVRVLKVGKRIQVETRGRIALDYTDDGRTYGPVLKDGCIGLRQMEHSRQVAYTHFKVWKVAPKSALP